MDVPGAIQIVPVVSKAELDRFIAVPMLLGSGDPNYVAPLIFERQESLSAKGNPFFEHADVQFWLAVRDEKALPPLERYAPVIAFAIDPPAAGMIDRP